MKDQEAKMSSLISLTASRETQDQACCSCGETSALRCGRQNAVFHNRKCDETRGVTFAGTPKRTLRNERGQIIVEYVLLLVFAVTIAMLITRAMVSRDPGNPGFVVQAWHAALTQIGSDKADDIKRE